MKTKKNHRSRDQDHVALKFFVVLDFCNVEMSILTEGIFPDTMSIYVEEGNECSNF